jgi:hypothetical protein
MASFPGAGRSALNTSREDARISPHVLRLWQLRVRYCLPGHLAAMSAVVGKAAENREERTTTALTAGVHLTAAVPGTGVGRQPIATSRLTALGQPGDGGAKALREPAIDGRQQVSGLGCGRLGRTTVRSRIGSSGALVGNHSRGCASAGNMSL